MSDSPSDGERGPVIEVEFSVSEPSYPFVTLATAAECRVELRKMLPREGDRYAEYFSVLGADPEDALGSATDAEVAVETRLLVRRESGCLIEVVVSERTPVWDLAELGAIPTAVAGTEGEGRIVAEIVPDEDPPAVVATFVEEHEVELVAKRERSAPAPLFGGEDLRAAVLRRLTDRQREVLFAAYDAGYYERPRRRTGEELADDLGISPATFQQHIRAAERKLVTVVAEERPGDPPVPDGGPATQ